MSINWNFETQLQCAICMDDVIGKSLLYPCMDSICRSCYDKWEDECEENSQKISCPFCKKVVVSVIDLGSKKLNMKSECPYRDSGCDNKKIMTVSELKEHISTECKFAPIDCDCGEQINKETYKDHLKKTCANRTVNCKKCNGKYKLNEEKSHNDECPFIVIKCKTCTYSCSRAKMRKHLCECKIMTCDKCNGEYMRKDLASHKSECKIITCDHCQYSHTKKIVEEHMKMCSDRLIICPVCQDPSYMKDWPDHVDDHMRDVYDEKKRITIEVAKKQDSVFIRDNVIKDNIMIYKNDVDNSTIVYELVQIIEVVRGSKKSSHIAIHALDGDSDDELPELVRDQESESDISESDISDSDISESDISDSDISDSDDSDIKTADIPQSPSVNDITKVTVFNLNDVEKTPYQVDVFKLCDLYANAKNLQFTIDQVDVVDGYLRNTPNSHMINVIFGAPSQPSLSRFSNHIADIGSRLANMNNDNPRNVGFGEIMRILGDNSLI